MIITLAPKAYFWFKYCKYGKYVNIKFVAMNILICEEESVIAEIISRILYKKGHIIYMASNSNEAINSLKLRKIDLLITDYNVVIEQKNFFMHFAKKINPELKIIVLSSLNTDYEKKLIQEMQACHIINKPFSKDQLERTIENIKARARAA